MNQHFSDPAQRRRSFTLILFAAGAALVFSACLWIFQNFIREFNADQASSALLAQLEQEAPDTPVSLLPEGQSLSGKLVIEKLGLELPVLNSYSEQNLAMAPCIWAGDPPAEGDLMVLSGHNYKRQFGPIDQLSAGDEVVYYDENGVAYHYTVYEVGQIPADGVEEANHTGEGKCLNLYTCDSTGNHRILVKCQNGLSV